MNYIHLVSWRLKSGESPRDLYDVNLTLIFTWDSKDCYKSASQTLAKMLWKKQREVRNIARNDI